MKPTLVLVGRPNVGKSTLFNRLVKKHQAIVIDEPGITRDRHMGQGRVGSKPYWIVDTGGFEADNRNSNSLLTHTLFQTKQAFNEADAVIFLLDAKTGVTTSDYLLADELRSHCRVPIFLAVNKTEGMPTQEIVAEFHELALGEPYAISATHGYHVRELIDTILEKFEIKEDLKNKALQPIFAIIGRPNVGKSTLVNTILGQKRVITADEPGTTRDSISVDFTFKGQAYTLIDTAGMRRRSRISEKIEKFSTLKTLQAIQEANVAVLVLDAKQGIADQDGVIANFALKAGCALVVAINKWDDIDIVTQKNINQSIKEKLAFLNFAQFHPISALKGVGITKLFRLINEAYSASMIKLPTPKLTNILIKAVKMHQPARIGRIVPKLRYAHQGGNSPPTVIIHGSALEHVSKSYTRFLENSFRKVFLLVGTPLRIQYKSGRNPYHTKLSTKK